MIRILPLLLLALLTFGCNNDLGVTDKEVNAVQQVLNFYDGVCQRHKGFEYEDSAKKIYFKLEMSKSALLESHTENLEQHAGNIAYLFYSSLEEEKSNYNQVRVTIHLEDGSNSEYSFEDHEIQEIEKLIPKIDAIYALLDKKDFDGLAKTFDKSIEVASSELSGLFNGVEAKYGAATQSQFQGFRFREDADNGPVILVDMVQVRKGLTVGMELVFERPTQNLAYLGFN